ncbi:MAG: tetratricopeptide repeat protein [Chloroflexia bacterium]
MRRSRPQSPRRVARRRRGRRRHARGIESRRHHGGRGRAQAIFAILGLLVVFTMIFGLVAVGFDGFGRGSEEDDPNTQDPTSNLVPTYEARLRDNPTDFNTMLILANILQNRGEYPESITWYQKAVDLKPDNIDARLAFGQTLAAYGQSFDAEAQYKKVLEIDPKNVRAEYYLGELYSRMNPPRTEEAKILRPRQRAGTGRLLGSRGPHGARPPQRDADSGRGDADAVTIADCGLRIAD